MSETTRLVRGGQAQSADGAHISYLARGRGPVIVGVHGGLGTALSLMPLADHLADKHTVVLVNLRGHGTSDRGRSEAHIDRYVDDVRAVIEEVGPVDALFGYSFGAVIALETALAAGDLIARLVLYEPPLPVTYPMPDMKWLQAMLDAGRYEELVLQALATGAGALSPGELAAVRDNPLWMSNVAHASTLLATMRALGSVDSTIDRYASITAHITLVLGTESAEHIRRAGELLASALPTAQAHHLAGQGHHFDPAVVAQMIAAAVPDDPPRSTRSASHAR